MTTPEYRDDRPARNTRPRASYGEEPLPRDYPRGYEPGYRPAPHSQREYDREYRTYRQQDSEYRSSRQSNRRAYDYRDERSDAPRRQRPAQRPRTGSNRDFYDDSPHTRQPYNRNRRRQPEYPDYPQRPRRRDEYADRSPRPSQQQSSIFDAFPWLRWALLALALVIALFAVVNVVSCIGGAISGGQADTASETTSENVVTVDTPADGSESSAGSSSSSQSQQGVVSPWTESGYFSTGDTELDNYIKKMCDDHSTEGETFDKNAYATFIWLSQDTDYVERAENQSPYGVGWDVEYAKQFFEKNNSGNCFNYVAVAQFMLQYFGYSDAEGQPCVVELESGNWGDHGLVFVTNKVDNKRCLVDVALSSNGWMLDINAYSYDIRNIEQNPTVKGNADVIDDGPTTIAPGNLTE